MRWRGTLSLLMLLAGCVPFINTSPPPHPPPHLSALTLLPPTPLHNAVWTIVADCLGFAPWNRPAPTSVAWATADTISTPDNTFAYGMTQMAEGGSPTAIVLETWFWWNSSVISHEVIHVLSGSYDHVGPEWECLLPSGVDLPLRRTF